MWINVVFSDAIGCPCPCLTAQRRFDSVQAADLVEHWYFDSLKSYIQSVLFVVYTIYVYWFVMFFRLVFLTDKRGQSSPALFPPVPASASTAIVVTGAVPVSTEEIDTLTRIVKLQRQQLSITNSLMLN